jgi:hypothetical protein
VIKVIFATLCLFSSVVYAGLPVEWSGTVGFDTFRIDSYRYTDTDTSAAYTENSMLVDGSAKKSKTQSYIMRLQPKIIVNDSTSFVGEFTVGSNRGGYLGQNSARGGNYSSNGFSFIARPSNSTSGLIGNQFYIELFTESAQYKVGRFSRNWGLGALYNDGNELWDRFISAMDGFEINYKIGNFTFTPSWTKISTDNLEGSTDVKELGVALSYKNTNSQTEAGIYYGARTAGANQNFYLSYLENSLATGTSATDYQLISIGAVNLKVLDIFFKKKWEKFSFGFEVPMVTGEADNPYGRTSSPTNRVDINSQAYIIETAMQFTPAFKVALSGGSVSGSDASDPSAFNAMNLNPNYQIANLMFRYNRNAVENFLKGKADPAGNGIERNLDLFSSSISNANFVRLATTYQTENWTWGVSFDSCPSC